MSLTHEQIQAVYMLWQAAVAERKAWDAVLAADDRGGNTEMRATRDRARKVEDTREQRWLLLQSRMVEV